MAAPVEERGQGVLITVTVVLVIYFFFPFLLIIPVGFGVRHHLLLANTPFRPLFIPVTFLHDHVKVYARALEAEEALVERTGLLKDL